MIPEFPCFAPVMKLSFKNIIFDFGGVIIPVDPMAFAGGLMNLGCTDVLSLHEFFIREQVYTRFEKGEMSPDWGEQVVCHAGIPDPDGFRPGPENPHFFIAGTIGRPQSRSSVQ